MPELPILDTGDTGDTGNDAHGRDGTVRGSGPTIARLFHALLALVFLVAFASLGVQIDLLIGSRGLLPLHELIASLRSNPEISFRLFPTLFWWFTGDVAITAGIWIGIAVSATAVFGRAPRLCFALLVPLYLSYAVVCREFLSFQWDNLLIECGLLALFLPRDRPAQWIHLLFRLLLVKLYWESGLAKWQSHLGDWQDGSAMTFYYETAPIPTALAWWAHQLPDWWHHFESRATLALELGVCLAVLGPRSARLAALVLLCGFQVLNAATANYGFFCFLALCLHVFLLDDHDLERAAKRFVRPLRGPRLERLAVGLRRWASPPAAELRPLPRARARAVAALAVLFSATWIALSINEAAWSFGERSGWHEATQELRGVYAPFRLVHAYHLFGHVTRERVEPSFETLGPEGWREHAMRYKAGPIDRSPPFVAPHQPRVDFRLWFHGLAYQRGMPRYVGRLLERLCDDPDAVKSLFSEALPTAPRAVRVSYWKYEFTSRHEARSSGAWWSRDWVGATRPRSCTR